MKKISYQSLIQKSDESLKKIVLSVDYFKDTREEALEVLINRVKYDQASESSSAPKNGW